MTLSFSPPVGILAQPGQWVRPVEYGPLFDPSMVYWVEAVEEGRIRYRRWPESVVSVYGPTPKYYTILPGEPQPWHIPQPMFGYTGIKYLDEGDPDRDGFWIVHIDERGECWDGAGPYDTFALAKEVNDRAERGDFFSRS